MTIGVPIYTVQCNDCHKAATFIMAQPHPGIYELPDVEAVYAQFGGETLPDGRHRCAKCRNSEPLSPDDFRRNLGRITNSPSAFRAAIDAAKNGTQGENL
jgi:hypothetical protein